MNSRYLLTPLTAKQTQNTTDELHNLMSCLFPETPGLIDVQPVEMLQDQAQCILGDYVRGRYSRQPTRFGRFLLMLPSLRGVRQSTVERLFFKETIGDIPIQRLLGDMYLMEKSYA